MHKTHNVKYHKVQSECIKPNCKNNKLPLVELYNVWLHDVTMLELIQQNVELHKVRLHINVTLVECCERFESIHEHNMNRKSVTFMILKKSLTCFGEFLPVLRPGGGGVDGQRGGCGDWWS